MSMGPPSKKARTAVNAYAPVKAADVFTWHLLGHNSREGLEKEIEEGGQVFECEFYHQVFGEEEEIQGYKGLTVNIYLHERTYHAWVDVQYASKLPGEPDVLQLLKEWFPEGFSTDKQTFLSTALAEEQHDLSAVGATLSSTTQEDGSTLLLQHSLLKDTPAWYKALHSRLEPLMVFTIDGANFLDKDDPQWEVVLAVKQQAGGQQSLVGIMTLYNFYAWVPGQVGSHRPRVAQILVVPPYQGQGIGHRLLTAAYDLARQRDTRPLTFEDPSPALQQLREKLELQMLLGCPWVVAAAENAVAAAELSAVQPANGVAAFWMQQLAARESRTSNAAAAAPASDPESDDGSDDEDSSDDEDGSNLLQLPSSIRDRIVTELKIHTPQVLLAWEALLWLQGPVQNEPAPNRAFHRLLVQRITAQHGNCVDECKRGKVGPVRVDGKEDDWFLFKEPKQAAAGPDEAAPVPDKVTVGRHNLQELDAEEWSARLAELEEERMQQLKRLAVVMSP